MPASKSPASNVLKDCKFAPYTLYTLSSRLLGAPQLTSVAALHSELPIHHSRDYHWYLAYMIFLRYGASLPHS